MSNALPRRHSLRLRNYDYAQPGAYYVTVCTHRRRCLFGRVVDGQMQLNEFGEIVRACCLDLPSHYNHVLLDAFVVMPNHIHAVIVLRDHDDNILGNTVDTTVVGAGLRPAPTTANDADNADDEAIIELYDDDALDDTVDTTVGAGLRPAPTTANDADNADDEAIIELYDDGALDNTVDTTVGAGLRPAPTTTNDDVASMNDDAPKRHAVPEIVRAFKSFSSRRINESRNLSGVRLWQRGYYDHVVRSEPDLDRIRIYIRDNPARWTADKYYAADEIGR